MNEPIKKKLETKYINIKNQIEKLTLEIESVKGELIHQFELDPLGEFNKLTVYPVSGRKSTSWQKIAKELKPSKELIEKYTKVGEPSFGVRIKTESDSE